jgi:hypothetical protein
MNDPHDSARPDKSIPSGLLVRTVPLGGDLQVRVSAQSTDSGERVLQLELERRAQVSSDTVADAGLVGEFAPTAARLRCPMHLTPLLVEAIERVAKRAAEAAV